MKQAKQAFIALLATTLSILFLTACSDSDKVVNLIEKAQSHFDSGNLGAAEIELKNALREDNKNAKVLALMGTVYMQQGRLRDAYNFLNAAVQIDPLDAASISKLAAIKFAAGLRDEALTDAKKALELDPSQTEAPMIIAELANTKENAQQTSQWLQSLPSSASIQAAIGSLELKLGNVAEASQRFDNAIEQAPNSPIGYAGRFQILLGQQKKEEAAAVFAKAAQLASARSAVKIRYVQFLQQQKGDDAAKTALDEILSVAPDYLPALGLAAELAAKQGKIEQSKQWVDQALKLDPIDPTALRVKGTLFVLEQKMDEAIAQLEKMLELYPEDIKANYQIALAYLANRDLPKAKSRLSRVVQRAPKHLEANALLSTVQVQEEDYSGAIITLENFLKVNPNSLQGYLLLAEVYNRKGENAKAVAIYQQLEKSQPENPQLDYLSGLSYLKGQNKSNARQSFESALANNPLHLQSVEQLTFLDVGDRNFDSALERIDQTIAATPDTSVLYTIRAQILLSKGDTDAALQSLEKSIELDTNNRTARTFYARVLTGLGKTDDAFKQYQAILKTVPDDLVALTSLATIHEEKERFKEATELYEKMLTIDGNYINALNNLAYLYSTRINKTERAFELAQKARDLTPTSPFTADTLGWIVYKRGDYRWARSLLSDSYAKLGNNVEVAYHLGSTDYMLGNTESARRLLEQASSSESDFSGKQDAKSKLTVLSITPENATESDKTFLSNLLDENSPDPMAQVALGKILEYEGKTQAAIASFRKAMSSTPSNLQAQLSLGAALLENGELTETEKVLKAANSQSPENPEISYLQAKLSLAQKNYNRALTLFQKSDALPQKPDRAYHLGLTYYSLGQIAEASKHLIQAQETIATGEKSASIKSMIGILNTDTLRYSSESASALSQHLGKFPNDAQALATLATLELRHGEIDSAKKGFEKALELSPDNLFAKLGMAEIQSEDIANAALIYKVASEGRDFPNEANRSKALLAIALHQQGKAELSKSQIEAVQLDALPESLRNRLLAQSE